MSNTYVVFVYPVVVSEFDKQRINTGNVPTPTDAFSCKNNLLRDGFCSVTVFDTSTGDEKSITVYVASFLVNKLH